MKSIPEGSHWPSLDPWQILTCPHCALALRPLGEGKSGFGCEKKHTFDKARDGYLYLLKQGGRHGDDKDMMRARHGLLESGCYQPLQTALASSVKTLARKPLQILDAGCGEGYYTVAALRAAPEGSVALGIDLSKEGLRLAGKRGRGLPLALAAASVYGMPVQSQSVDCLLSVFSPFAAEEFQRVLKKDGYLFSVIPAERHLWELKCLLYEHPYENTVQDFLLPGFKLESVMPVDYTATVSQPELSRLFAMTPYFYRTPSSGKERLAATPSLTLTLSFRILGYQLES